MPRKLNNETFDEKICERFIKRIDNYCNSKTKIRFMCLAVGCNYVWSTLPRNIIAGFGCPKCSGNLKLTNNYIDDILFNKNIKRIGNYHNSTIPVKVQCLNINCNYIWEARLNHLMNGPGRCPRCIGNKKIDNNFFDIKLQNKKSNIIRIGNYVSARTPIDFQCNNNHIWKATPDNILRGKNCPQCNWDALSKDRRRSDENIDIELSKRSIKRIDPYINGNIPIQFQCLTKNCGYIWKTKTSHIINSNSGCPNCSAGKNQKIVYSTLKKLNILFEPQKSIIELNKTEMRIRVDFYISKYNVIIEYNGHQHYQPVRFNGIAQEIANSLFIKQKDRDRYLQEWCNSNDVKLICIDGRKYTNDKLVNYINNELVKEIGVK